MKKASKAIVCTILILLVLLGFVAKYWANGIYPGQSSSGSKITAAAGKNNYQGMFPVCLYKNDFGRTTIVWTLDMGSDSFRKLFNLIGRKQIILSTQTVTPGVATHLDFFNALHSPRQFNALVEDAGMPTQILSLVTSDVAFKTVDGYEYHVRLHRDGLCILTDVIDPAGNHQTDEQIDALTVKVLIFYLGIAAILGVILVLLIKIPNNIRKRKAAIQGG